MTYVSFTSARSRPPSRAGQARRRVLASALACAAALSAMIALSGGRRAEAATQSAPLVIGASIDIRCTIITVPLSFGDYSPFDPADHDAMGEISLNCTPSNFTIRIRMSQGLYPGPGSNNSNPLRQMSDGAGNFIQYNLYRDAARTQVWGGTNPTGVNPPNGPWPMLLPVYARIPALQAPQPGEYSDTVAVTVLF